MTTILGFQHRTGVRIGEIGYLFVLFAGVWLAAAQVPMLGWARGRTAVAGLALAIGAVLLIVATHWGHFA